MGMIGDDISVIKGNIKKNIKLAGFFLIITNK